MRSIRIMDERLASKIAAGEVVERPVSVVKELVENSIDAGATEITIHVAEGGRRLIKVADNGEGMNRTDAQTALRRHATSKISTEEDLGAISTLGFRGEALWSIASVSRVRLVTRRPSDPVGTLVRVEGGRTIEVMEHGCPAGTVVEVRDLFYNTPARARFLRTPGTEFSRILELVKRMALAYPAIRFRLLHGSSKVLDTPSADAPGRLRDLFGRDIAKRLIPVATRLVEGYVARPDISFSSAKALYTYVNRRAVTDRGLNRSIMLAYGTLIDDSRYPFALINLKLDPSEVDVNVHPAKSEVRFRNTRMVYEEVRTAVKKALGSGSMETYKKKDFSYRPANPLSEGMVLGEAKGQYMTGALQKKSGEALDFKETAGEPPLNPEFLEMEVVGQLWGEFLVTEAGGGHFYIIDQHGAAERAAFERLKRDFFERGSVPRQLLLLPERLETTPEESEALKTVMDTLQRLGFDIIPFGPSGRRGG